MTWEAELRERLDGFRRHHHGHHGDGVPVSIKVRVDSGCYCRGCCKAAWRIIEAAAPDYRRGGPTESHHDGEIEYREHESGPEWLVWLGVASNLAQIVGTLASLAVIFISARAKGQKQGDTPKAPLELIVRGFDKDGKMFEERVLRIPAGDESTHDVVQRALETGLKPALPPAVNAPKPTPTPNPKRKATARQHKRKRPPTKP